MMSSVCRSGLVTESRQGITDLLRFQWTFLPASRRRAASGLRSKRDGIIGAMYVRVLVKRCTKVAVHRFTTAQ